jgi:hypothetical protein
MNEPVKNLNINVLLDVYSPVLTERQNTVLELYYGEDLSLGEIAEQLDITRQGVLNCVQKGGQKLFETEAKLGLVRKSRELESDIDKLEGLIMLANMQNLSVLAQIDELIMGIKQKI